MNTKNNLIARESDLHDELDRSHLQLTKLETSLQKVTDELENQEGIKERFEALEQVCLSLEHLHELGGFSLFSEKETSEDAAVSYISGLRGRVNGFDEELSSLEVERDDVLAEIHQVNNNISLAQEGIIEVQELIELRKHDFVIEREIPVLPYRPMVMPWSSSGPDEKLIRKYVAISFIASFFLWFVIPLIQVPLPDPTAEVKIPERLAKLLKKQEPIPQPKQDDDRQKSESKSKTKKQARKKAEKSGVLAFKDNFTELMSMTSIENLGASAKINNSGQQSNQAARNLVVSKSASISGINSSSLSRNTSNAGSGLSGVQFSRVESSIGIGDAGADRPTGSTAPVRSDEDIQIIFDRYKTSLYRIYQRELRKNPTLQGNIVLRITIGASGSVLSCTVESSDLNSPSLASKIIARVLQFKFNKKKGSSKMTILYPIDFLPIE